MNLCKGYENSLSILTIYVICIWMCLKGEWKDNWKEKSSTSLLTAAVVFKMVAIRKPCAKVVHAIPTHPVQRHYKESCISNLLYLARRQRSDGDNLA